MAEIPLQANPYLCGVADATRTFDSPAGAPVRLAGFCRRFAAFAVDWMICGVALVPVVLVISASMDLARSSDNSTGLVIDMVALFAMWLYFASMESSRFQGTVGKLALGIKVTNLDGERMSFDLATTRFFGKFMTAAICGIGFITIAFNRRKQGPHDMFAKCLVVHRL